MGRTSVGFRSCVSGRIGHPLVNCRSMGPAASCCDLPCRRADIPDCVFPCDFLVVTRRGACGMLNETIDHVHDLPELRSYIHRTLCEKENLLADQFRMTEMVLTRRGKPCGTQFSLQGPRRVRLGAIWVAERNEIYFYDARGNRYLKVRLRHRLRPECEAA